MADWYYSRDNTQQGPVSDLEIRNLISTQQISEETMIWREGMEGWLPLRDVQDFQLATQGSSSASNTPLATTTPQSMSGIVPGAEVPTDGLAIASIVCGILSLFMCSIVSGIPAVICGHMALSKIKANPTTVGGKGLAIVGLITGYLSILFIVGGVLITLLAGLTFDGVELE